MSTPSSNCPTQGDHIQDLRNLLQEMSLSDSSFDTITWSCKATEESITLSRSSLPQSTPASTCLQKNQHPFPLPPQLTCIAQAIHLLLPHHPASNLRPSEIHPLQADETPEGFWVITVGQEVSVFYCWANIAEQTNFISGNVQKGYPSFQQALAAYMVKFGKGRVQAVPLPGGPFWPSPPESLPNPPSLTLSVDSSVSLDLYALWSQVEDLTEAMSQLQ
ncbi:hypothetical protein BD769DRAFT_1664317 [Suillus cothurnatus]|nr:hypothetical protein BD769DRAFT_1664317 [Suillus cothurnatus]